MLSRNDILRPVAAGRRRSGLLVLACVVLLGGCGFHLRGEHFLPATMSPVSITGVGRFTEFYQRLARAFETNGVTVTEDPANARTVLELEGLRGDQFVTAVDDEGKAEEYALSRTVGFSLKDAATREVLVPYRRLDGERLYSLTPGTGFGTTLERQEIIDQIDQAMVDSILRAISLQLR